MIPQLDLAADIVPGFSLGGFEVGRAVVDYDELLRSDSDAVVVRTLGLWQVEDELSQIYEPSIEELESFRIAFDEFETKSRAGLDADLGDLLASYRRPESAPAIGLWVDIRDGVIDAVTALPGYEGSLIGIAGMTYAQALIVEPRIEAPQFADEARIAGVKGVRLVFYPADPEPIGEAVRDRIVVFDPTRTDNGTKPH